MRDKQKITRYNVTPEGLGEINIDEDKNGEYIKYDDIFGTIDYKYELERILRTVEQFLDNPESKDTLAVLMNGRDYLKEMLK